MQMRRVRPQFDSEEVTQLLELATRLEQTGAPDPDQGLTYDQLVRVAGELGISEDAVQQAISERGRGVRAEVKAVQRRVRRQMRFLRHLTVYLVVVAGLFLIDLAGGGRWWFYWVAGLWGIVLALHGLRFVTRRGGPMERYLRSRRAGV